MRRSRGLWHARLRLAWKVLAAREPRVNARAVTHTRASQQAEQQAEQQANKRASRQPGKRPFVRTSFRLASVLGRNWTGSVPVKPHVSHLLSRRRPTDLSPPPPPAVFFTFAVAYLFLLCGHASCVRARETISVSRVSAFTGRTFLCSYSVGGLEKVDGIF